MGEVVAVCRCSTHSFSKPLSDAIHLIAGLGVDGDAHQGRTVQHRSRVALDPTQPNLRQIHLIHVELLDELRLRGFVVAPGQLGENITTRGVELLALPVGALLRLGAAAVVEITGLRNPCRQLDDFLRGLKSAVLGRDAAGKIHPRAGVMGIVRTGGVVRPGDSIAVVLPPLPHRALQRV